MKHGGFVVRLSNVQIIVVVTTIVLLAIFTWLVARTRLGRDMRACEQDQTMAALLGVDVDRTISMTFVIGAALAAVAGMMYLLYYGLVDFFMGFVAGIKAFTAAVLGGIGSLPGAMLGGLAIGLIETFWSAYFSVEYKDVAAFSILIVVLIFLPPACWAVPKLKKFDGRRRDHIAPGPTPASRHPGVALLKKALISALVALVLFSLMIGIRTEAGPTGQLIYWTRFGDLAHGRHRFRRQHRCGIDAAVVGTVGTSRCSAAVKAAWMFRRVSAPRS